MKKLLLIAAAMLVLAASAVAIADSAPGSKSIAQTTDNRTMAIWMYYLGTGDNDWDCFYITLYSNWTFDGTWWEDTDSGSIEGWTIAPGVDSCKAIGYYYDDQNEQLGTWSGTFGLQVDTCYGRTMRGGGDPTGSFQGKQDWPWP